MSEHEATRVTLAEATELLRSTRELVGVDFTGLDLRRAFPREPEGAYTFRGCVLRDVSAAGLDLTGATFDGVVVDEADFGEARLEETVWSGVTGLKFSAARAVATRARFERCSLIGADFAGASLAEASFTSTRLAGAVFAKARLRDTRFADCHLVAADLRGVSLHKQTLRHVDLSEANLSGADLREAVFDGGRLRDARFVDARFAGADLRRVDLGALSPQACAALRGAVISPAQAAELVRGLGLQVM